MAKAQPDFMDKTDPHFAFKYMSHTAPDPPSIGQSSPLATRPWLYVYLPVAWAGHLCLGLAIGVLGPLQPYLARQVGLEGCSWPVRKGGPDFSCGYDFPSWLHSFKIMGI